MHHLSHEALSILAKPQRSFYKVERMYDLTWDDLVQHNVEKGLEPEYHE
jgi:hypothetical protein